MVLARYLMGLKATVIMSAALFADLTGLGRRNYFHDGTGFTGKGSSF